MVVKSYVVRRYHVMKLSNRALSYKISVPSRFHTMKCLHFPKEAPVLYNHWTLLPLQVERGVARLDGVLWECPQVFRHLSTQSGDGGLQTGARLRCRSPSVPRSQERLRPRNVSYPNVDLLNTLRLLYICSMVIKNRVWKLH